MPEFAPVMRKMRPRWSPTSFSVKVGAGGYHCVHALLSRARDGMVEESVS